MCRPVFAIAAMLASWPVQAQTYTITTVAGNGTRGYFGDGGQAVLANLNRPAGVAVDQNGNLYIADTFNRRIRKVTPAGIITTYAGTGVQGYSGDGGPATQARLSNPNSLVLDAAGNLYISDEGNNRIRRVDTSGIITTVAGNGTESVDGDNILATASGLTSPNGLAIDETGNLYVSMWRFGDARIRKVAPGPFGLITTAAGTGVNGSTGTGGPATAARIEPIGVGVDPAGNIYIAEDHYRVRRVGLDGIITEFAGNGGVGSTGDGGPATSATLSAIDIKAGKNGTIYILDRWQDRVRLVDPLGTIQTVAGSTGEGFSGDGGPAAAARMRDPLAMTIDHNGNIYIADTLNDRVRKLTPASAITLNPPSQTLPGTATSGTVALTIAPTGTPWSAASLASWITLTGAISGTGNATISFSLTANPSIVARTGTVYVSGEVFTVTQAGSPGPGLKFVPLPPCRIVDTRTAYAPPRTGPFGPPLLNAGSTRTVPVLSSTTCIIPATAKAYVFNVTLDTVENSTGPVDSLTVWPAGEPRPDFHTARTTTGGYIANAAIVKAGANGAVNVYTSHNVNFILDINGYFTDDPNTPGMLFYPVNPCRAIDTRGQIYSQLPAPYGNLRMQSRENRTFRMPGSPGCQLPPAAAYSLELTLAPGSETNGNPVAFITAYPTGLSQPNVSNMNAFFGYAVANSAIVPASSNGSIDVFTYDATNLIVDVNGYFAPDDGTNRGLYYYPVTQCRMLNTQDATLTGAFGGPQIVPGGDRTIPIPSSARCGGLPIEAKAWALNASVVPGGTGMPYLSMWPSGTPWPNISQLNAFQGQTVANSAIVPSSANGSVDLRVAGPTHVVLDVAGYFSR